MSGAGVVNNSGNTQTFVTESKFTSFSEIVFTDNATAGSNVVYDNGGFVVFFDSSTASDATYVTSHAKEDNANPPFVLFGDDSTADNATFVNLGGTTPERGGGQVLFQDNSMAGTATFVNQGGVGISAAGSSMFFQHSSSADRGIFTIDGGSAAATTGGLVYFGDSTTAEKAVLIANGGTNGGEGGAIQFWFNSTGGQARMKLFGNASLDISPHLGEGVSVGSIEGDGMIFLGKGFGEGRLTVGTNNANTIFSGVIQDGGIVGGSGGSLTKSGTGTLRLTGANTYTGGTIVEAGTLLVGNSSGSGSGTGMVQVNGGTLGGKGIISGPVTVGTGSGTGAFLAPSKGASSATTLTIQSALTFKADGIYTYKLNSQRARADQIIANGVTIESGAQFNFVAVTNNTLTPGTVFTAIRNTSGNPIAGNFGNLPDGSTFTVAPNNYQASYSGGDGNDLTLTVIP